MKASAVKVLCAVVGIALGLVVGLLIFGSAVNWWFAFGFGLLAGLMSSRFFTSEFFNNKLRERKKQLSLKG